MPGSRYKSLLQHMYRHKPSRRRVISMKKYRQFPKTINENQFQQLMKACTNHRDKFLMALLYETGMRIGQALGL